MELKLGAQATTSNHWLTLGKIRLSVAIVYLFILPVLYSHGSGRLRGVLVWIPQQADAQQASNPIGARRTCAYYREEAQEREREIRANDNGRIC